MDDDTDQQAPDELKGMSAAEAHGYRHDEFRDVGKACHRWLMQHDEDYAADHDPDRPRGPRRLSYAPW